MDKSIQIAGKYTIGDWLNLKASLENYIENNALWEKAFSYLEERLNSRYLQPIEVIENNSNIEGEGFAISAIMCSLIEALEAFYQGKSYRKATKDNPLDETKEYYKSQPIFESFLNNREPFKKYFTEAKMAAAFYENYRCSILHEAATRNGWKIRIDTNSLVEEHNGGYVVNRAIFVNEIKNYIKIYKKELMRNAELKKAYIRKFDAICAIA